MENNFAFIKTNKKFVKLRFDEIAFIKGLGNYVEILTIKGEKFIYYKSLKDLRNDLPDEFMRIHNSCIVNLTNIDSFEENHVIIKNVKLSVAKTYRDCFASKIESLLL